MVIFSSLTIIIVLPTFLRALFVLGGEAPEPYPELYGVCPTCGPPRPASPDPLVRYTWNKGINASILQIYRVERPTKYYVDPSSAISGAESLAPNSSGPLTIEVRGSGSLRLDWGVERAAWLEFESPDLAELLKMQQQESKASASFSNNTTIVTAGISEYNSPYEGKTLGVIQYGNTTFRLETNDELYEGVRFTWLFFNAPTEKPWHITKISLVAKVKPVNYTGFFDSSDPTITECWYTGAYGVRLNMEADAFNSILIERGDRVSIQGDGHPTMATGLVAFSPFDLVKDMLDQTNSGYVNGHQVVDQSIMSYPIYWTMSVNDWFLASGDVAGFLELAPDAMSIIDKRVHDFLQKDLDIVWMGCDDRLGNGWCFHVHNDTCTREAHLTFAGLVVRACRDLSLSLRLAGMIAASQKYEAHALELGNRLRQVDEWPEAFGVHAAANAINTGVTTEDENALLFETSLNDSTNICSWSSFNQYWILQALGNADKMDHAVASIKLCWAPMLKLGKGCFWEMFSPEWASFLSDGDEAPTIPSYCHPWASGVSAWLSNVLGGVQPLLPGYAEYVAAPYVSTRNPNVSTVVNSQFGAIEVSASLQRSRGQNERNAASLVLITVKASVPGFVGIRRHIAGMLETGSPECAIDAQNVLVNGIQTTVGSAADIAAHSEGDLASFALGGHFVPTKANAYLFVRIPTEGRHIISASYSGTCLTIASNSISVSDTVVDDGMTGDHAISTVVPTKNNNQSVSLPASIPHVPPFPVPEYHAVTKIDRNSHGDGLAVHGRDGYILLGFDNGKDLYKLPSYIRNSIVHTHEWAHGWWSRPRVFLGISANDPSYLPDPRKWRQQYHFTNKTDEREALRTGNIYAQRIRKKINEKSKKSEEPDLTATNRRMQQKKNNRALGVVTQDPNGFGMVVDVEVVDKVRMKELRNRAGNRTVVSKNIASDEIQNESFWVSIYCVAERASVGEKQAIRIMDFKTLNVIAPTGYISDYNEGVWFSVRYHDSIRLRIMGIKGIRISAVAFSREDNESGQKTATTI